MKFLTLEEVLAIHHEVPPDAPDDVDRGLLSRSALVAALSRCEHGPYFEFHGDLAERAALLLRGIIQEHPFLNANKRTGLLAADAFLRLNGQFLDVPARTVETTAIQIAEGRLMLGEIREWLLRHQQTLKRSEGGWSR